jgi:hypothetical protein
MQQPYVKKVLQCCHACIPVKRFGVADPGAFSDYPDFDDSLWCKLDDLGGKVCVVGCRTVLSHALS